LSTVLNGGQSVCACCLSLSDSRYTSDLDYSDGNRHTTQCVSNYFRLSLCLSVSLSLSSLCVRARSSTDSICHTHRDKCVLLLLWDKLSRYETATAHPGPHHQGCDVERSCRDIRLGTFHGSCDSSSSLKGPLFANCLERQMLTSVDETLYIISLPGPR